jgi:membrane protease YdiL (CAAX protease family)
LSTRPLRTFFLTAFGLSWGCLVLLAFQPPWLAGVLGAPRASHPLFMLAVYSPAVAALLIVGARRGGLGIWRFLSRALLWRCPVSWWLFLLVGIPAVFYIGAALAGTLGDGLVPFDGAGAALAAMAFMIVLGPVEEFGWRGFALPLLQRRLPPLWAGLMLGVIWGVWHLPAFFMGGTPQIGWGFTPFLVGSIALSVIVTRLFNVSRGSILLPAFFHYQLINPLWPDARPYDTVIFGLVAVIVVALNREAMLTRSAGVTGVIPE